MCREYNNGILLQLHFKRLRIDTNLHEPENAETRSKAKPTKSLSSKSYFTTVFYDIHILCRF